METVQGYHFQKRDEMHLKQTEKEGITEKQGEFQDIIPYLTFSLSRMQPSRKQTTTNTAGETLLAIRTRTQIGLPREYTSPWQRSFLGFRRSHNFRRSIIPILPEYCSLQSM